MSALKIEYLYPEFCGIFGDQANIAYLKKCLPDATFYDTPIEEVPHFVNEDVDMIYIGQMTERSQKRVLSKSMEQLISKVCEDLHCSKTMEASLWQHFRYLMLTGVDVQAQIREWYEEEKLPCRDRREGKKCFEELKAGLF